MAICCSSLSTSQSLPSHFHATTLPSTHPSPRPPAFGIRCTSASNPHPIHSSSASKLFTASSPPFLGEKSLERLRFKPACSSRISKSALVSVQASLKGDSLKVMISGAPASGKGTQCEMIVQKYGLTHIAAGDLLRAEVAAGTENGKRAKEFMTKGQLVPDEIVVTMVKDRLSHSDVHENGWLLDGYPRSFSQAQALEVASIRPDIFILLDVPDEFLIERVVGRRLDPVTGKIYHLKYNPPESDEIAARLTQRFDDTEAKAKLRLQTHSQNVEAVLSIYSDVIKKVDGNQPKEEVFQEIDKLLADLLVEPQEIGASTVAI